MMKLRALLDRIASFLFKKSQNKDACVALGVLIAAIVLYNYFWDIIGADRILSLNAPLGATVWDMGQFYNTLWINIHSFSTQGFLLNLSFYPLSFLISPLSYIDNPFFFVYFQTFSISFAALPLYIISFKRLKSRLVSVIISISYLLFFGIAGLNWFDLHFVAFFVPLFITGYALHLIGWKRTSALIVLLSGLTQFPYMIFAFLFFSFSIYEHIKERASSGITKVYYVGLILSILFLVLGYVIGISGIVHETYDFYLHKSSAGLVSNITSDIDNKVITFLLLLAPFLMLPLLMKKWIVFILPYVALVFYAGFYEYYFPAELHYQYLSMIVPFLFIGTIEALSNLKFIDSSKGVGETNKHRFKIKPWSPKLKIALTILILVILLGLVYEPYGPLNGDSSTNFYLNDVTDINSSLYYYYETLVSLIPSDDPYVLYQNNMPQVIYRDPSALNAYTLGESNNFTYDIQDHWTQSVDYIIADPYSGWFTIAGEYILNMYATLYHFIENDSYGILAESAGLLLLKKGFSGRPLIYVPENNYFPASKLDVLDGIRNNGTISSSGLNNGQTLWYGPYTFLQPGTYRLTLQVKAANLSTYNKFALSYSYILPSGSILDVHLFNVTGSQLSKVDEWTNISFTIFATNFYNQVQFVGQGFNWSDSFYIKGISLKQTSYNS